MKSSTLTLALLLVMASAQAQLYKWVAPDGTVSYSDKPPPSSTAKVERKSYSSGGPSTTDFPFELAEATKNNPVTLYTMANCASCESGRKLLTDRGVPFSEKTVNNNDDLSQVSKSTGDVKLPALTVGRSKQPGFDSSQWNSMLTAAGYPTSNKLPKSYSNPAPEAAAPKAAGTPAKKADAEKSLPSLPSPGGNAPPDFHF